LGCLHSLIMNTAVWFGHGPEVVCWGWEPVSLARFNSQISGLWWTVTWKAKFFLLTYAGADLCGTKLPSLHIGRGRGWGRRERGWREGGP
jgi:hypothetical protein